MKELYLKEKIVNQSISFETNDNPVPRAYEIMNVNIAGEKDRMGSFFTSYDFYTFDKAVIAISEDPNIEAISNFAYKMLAEEINQYLRKFPQTNVVETLREGRISLLEGKHITTNHLPVLDLVPKIPKVSQKRDIDENLPIIHPPIDIRHP